MNPGTLIYEVRDRVAYVTFSTPERLNSITEERLVDLEAAIAAVEADESICAMVISGQGRAFCVGDDLDLLTRAFEDFDYFEGFLKRFAKVLLRLEQLEVPVIAAANGLTRAGGFELTLCCDIVLVADDAQFGDVHLAVHVLPGGGATQRLPRLIGEQRAKELIWSAKWLTGPEAVEYGLALRSVPRERLDEEVEQLLAGLRDKPRQALASVKRMVHRARHLPVNDGVYAEIEEFFSYLRAYPYGRDGFAASRKAVQRKH